MSGSRFMLVRMVLNISPVALGSVIDALRTLMVVAGYLFSSTTIASSKGVALLDTMMRFEAPASAKAVEIARPIPWEPPVTRTVFPLVDKASLSGEIAG